MLGERCGESGKQSEWGVSAHTQFFIGGKIGMRLGDQMESHPSFAQVTHEKRTDTKKRLIIGSSAFPPSFRDGEKQEFVSRWFIVIPIISRPIADWDAQQLYFESRICC